MLQFDAPEEFNPNEDFGIVERRQALPTIEDALKGIDLDLYGIVLSSENDPERQSIFFNINVRGYCDNMLCRYTYRDHYPLIKGDTVYIKGHWIEIIHLARYQKCFDVDSISARYEFDLATFLSDVFPSLIDSEQIKRLAYNIQDYANSYYGEGVQGVVECFNNLSSNLTRANTEIEAFTEHLYGKESFFNERVKTVRSFLARYLNDSLKRPLQLLGVIPDEIDQISIPLYDAYRICIKNPFRLPEISKERAEKICMGHLRMTQIPEEWLSCGDINRFIYNNLKKKAWTSTPIARVKASFPTKYIKYHDLLIKEYFCFEDLEHVYYTPIMKKEEFVSKFISQLIKKEEIVCPDPVYCGAEPSEEQDLAIKGILRNKISIMTGGPGTGKTKSLGHIAQTIVRNGGLPLFIAYTGVASIRIKKSLKDCDILHLCKVMTIHMAISQHSMITDLAITHVIIDEASMLDISLFARFISAFYSLNLSYTFVGDINQLEQISYGSVMAQLMKTPIKQYRLTKNFRSELGILTMINEVIDEERIKEQRTINWRRNFPDFQFYDGGINLLTQFIQFQYNQYFLDNPSEDVNQHSSSDLSNITPQKMIDFDNRSSVEKFIKYRDLLTIVCPFKKICIEVNGMFQSIFMKDSPFTIIDGKKYHLHDRIMKLINNYGIEVMNGETGKIIEIYNDFVVVQFRDEDGGTCCPFFGKARLYKTKEIQKALDNTFTPYDKDENGIKIEKNLTVIRTELETLRGKMSNFFGKGFGPDDVNDFFDVAIRYPFAMFSAYGAAEFLKIDAINLAYAITTHKSQGDQYSICLYFVCGKASSFVSIKNVYTGMSRAKHRLIVMSEGEELINSCIMMPGRFTHENFATRINSKLPSELLATLEPVENIDDDDDMEDDMDIDDDFDAYN
jgi:hypothetical protein